MTSTRGPRRWGDALVRSAPAPWGRFDDLIDGRALLFDSPVREVAAARPAEVAGVLEQVEEATRAGSWAFGYLGYEAAGGLDPALPVREAAPDDPPLAWFAVTAPPRAVPVIGADPQRRHYAAGPWQPAWSAESYTRDVAAVRARIAAGDTYQCNLTTRLHATVRGDALGLYQRIATNQRGRYAAYLDLGTHVIASASPELFFEWSDGRLLTRPMKGTAARGRSGSEDEAVRRLLCASPKERAENVIVVDLLRNDLGRIAEIGSVRVPVLCRAERYDTLWQLTSDVTARPAAGTGLTEIFRALFPCGSVTGAPKVRTMDVIREIEGSPRGVYCGAIGWAAPQAAPLRARFSVAIRTVVAERRSGSAVYGTGGGITWASTARAEAEELTAKAKILHIVADPFQLLETMAFRPGGGVRNLDRHLDRLAGSARYFGFTFGRGHAVALIATVGGPAPRRVRLLLGRDGELTLDVGDLPATLDRPVRLAVDHEPMDTTGPWTFHKTSRRDAYVERAQRHRDAEQVVLVNESGFVTETTVANIAVRHGRTWVTPPVADGCLPGVERARLVEAGRLHEEHVKPDDLRAADQLAVISSLRGWRPAVLLADL